MQRKIIKILRITGIAAGVLSVIAGIAVLAAYKGLMPMTSVSGGDYYSYLYQAVSYSAYNTLMLEKTASLGFGFLLISLGLAEICYFGNLFFSEAKKPADKKRPELISPDTPALQEPARAEGNSVQDAGTAQPARAEGNSVQDAGAAQPIPDRASDQSSDNDLDQIAGDKRDHSGPEGSRESHTGLPGEPGSAKQVEDSGAQNHAGDADGRADRKAVETVGQIDEQAGEQA